MVGKEILNRVYEFIKNNPNRNQSDIVRGLKEVCTRLPVLDAIDELTSDKDGREPKVKFSRNMPRGSYRYYVNDKNEYTILIHEIDRTYEFMTRYSNAFHRSQPIKEMLKVDKQISDFIYLTQLILYTRITDIASKIGLNIESNDNREILYLRLVQLLDKSNKLNKFIAPLLLPSLDSLLATAEKGGSKKMVDYIRGIFNEIRSEVLDLNPSSNLT